MGQPVTFRRLDPLLYWTGILVAFFETRAPVSGISGGYLCSWSFLRLAAFEVFDGSPKARLFDQFDSLARGDPDPASLVLFRPIASLMLYPEWIDLDVTQDRPLFPHAPFLELTDQLGPHGSMDARFFVSFGRCGLLWGAAFDRPAFRHRPAAFLAGRDQ
jgi:hypothetical protein